MTFLKMVGKSTKYHDNVVIYFFQLDDTPVCCTPKQAEIMEKSFEMAEQLFGRCQTCVKNMLKSICELACSPNQNYYINVSKTETNNGKKYVTELNYHIDENYTVGTFESCKSVVHPSSGLFALDLACGTPAKDCTHEKWFSFMGHHDPVANPFVPFEIKYIWDQEGPNGSFTADTKSCSENYEGYFECSCVDCKDSCPSGIDLEGEEPAFKVLEMNGVTFIVAIVIGALGVISIILGGIFGRKLKIFELPKLFGGYSFVNQYLKRFFKWWGKRN